MIEKCILACIGWAPSFDTEGRKYTMIRLNSANASGFLLLLGHAIKDKGSMLTVLGLSVGVVNPFIMVEQYWFTPVKQLDPQAQTLLLLDIVNRS